MLSNTRPITKPGHAAGRRIVSQTRIAKRIKAILTDLDGTAVTHDAGARPSAALVAAVVGAKDRLRISTATGRAWDSAEHIIKELGLTDPCIIASGTQIVDPATSNIIWQETIPDPSTRAVGALLTTRPYGATYVQGLNVSYHISHFRGQTGVNVIYIHNVPREDIKPFTAALSAVPGVTITRALSWYGHGTIDLHVTHLAATKEHAVRQLSRLISVPAKYMVGIGDGFNDLGFFNAVGHRVAMGNAVPELKAAADEVIGSLSDDGLAAYISGLTRSPTL